MNLLLLYLVIQIHSQKYSFVVPFSYSCQICVTCTKDRQYAAWIGGSIYSSLSSAAWVSSKEYKHNYDEYDVVRYQESGYRVVNTNFF